MNSRAIFFEPVYTKDPHYISLVDTPSDLPEPLIKPYRIKNPRIMCPLAQLYIASLTVIGLFIVFRLSLAK